MITQNVEVLKIYNLTQAQYERELAAGNIDPHALYLTNKNEGGGSSSIINDSEISATKTWSSQKLNNMLNEYVNHVAQLLGGDA